MDLGCDIAHRALEQARAKLDLEDNLARVWRVLLGCVVYMRWANCRVADKDLVCQHPYREQGASKVLCHECTVDVTGGGHGVLA